VQGKNEKVKSLKTGEGAPREVRDLDLRAGGAAEMTAPRHGAHRARRGPAKQHHASLETALALAKKFLELKTLIRALRQFSAASARSPGRQEQHRQGR
jgi:hypothetical protein